MSKIDFVVKWKAFE